VSSDVDDGTDAIVSWILDFAESALVDDARSGAALPMYGRPQKPSRERLVVLAGALPRPASRRRLAKPIVVSCRLSATGIRFSVIRYPPRNQAPLTVGLPAHIGRTSTGLPRSARISSDRDGCSLNPGDGGAPPGQAMSLTGACRSTAASPCTPLQHPTWGSPHDHAALAV
jgi:hypothetical protein